MKNKSGILIYDGDCPYCKIASGSVKKLEDEVSIIGWQNKTSQNFLEAQFDSTPFSMVFVDSVKGKVYVGDSAVNEVTNRSEVTKPIGSIISDNYDSISSVVGFLTKRQKDLDKEYYGCYDIAESAQEELDELYKEAM